MSKNNNFRALSGQDSANDNGEKTSNLPMALESYGTKPSLNLNKIPADFLSQLIAERAHLAAQRPKRRAPVSLATKAYNTARRIAIKRMPTGYTYRADI